MAVLKLPKTGPLVSRLLLLRNLIPLRLDNPLLLNSHRLCQFLLYSSIYLRSPPRHLRVVCNLIFFDFELEVIGFNANPVAQVTHNCDASPGRKTPKSSWYLDRNILQ